VSALSRPVIVEHLVQSARRHGADAVGHGCTGGARTRCGSRCPPASASTRRVASRGAGGSRGRSTDRRRGEIPIGGDQGKTRTDESHAGPCDRVRCLRIVVGGARLFCADAYAARTWGRGTQPGSAGKAIALDDAHRPSLIDSSARCRLYG
jgi:hypothetical protein